MAGGDARGLGQGHVEREFGRDSVPETEAERWWIPEAEWVCAAGHSVCIDSDALGLSRFLYGQWDGLHG